MEMIVAPLLAWVVERYSHRWTMYGNSSTIYFSHKRSILLKANRIIDDDLLISIKCFAVTLRRDQERDCGACMNLWKSFYVYPSINSWITIIEENVGRIKSCLIERNAVSSAHSPPLQSTPNIRLKNSMAKETLPTYHYRKTVRTINYSSFIGQQREKDMPVVDSVGWSFM